MLNLNSATAISKKGKEIYDARYKDEYEVAYQGKFIAINILDGTSTLGDTASKALLSAQAISPEGLFHLIRVGHRGAFEMGLAHKDAATNRLHR